MDENEKNLSNHSYNDSGEDSRPYRPERASYSPPSRRVSNDGQGRPNSNPNPNQPNGRPSNSSPQNQSWQPKPQNTRPEKTPPPLPSRPPLLHSHLPITDNQLQMLESMMRKRNWSLEYFVKVAGKTPEFLNHKEATYWINCLNNTTKRT